MNVNLASFLAFTLLLLNTHICHSQITHDNDTRDSGEEDWPTKMVLVTMIDQLRNQFDSSIEQINLNLQNFKADNERLNSTVHALETDNQLLSSDVEILKSDNERLNSTVHALETDNQQLRSEVEILKSDNQLNSTVLELQEHVSQLDTKHQRSAFSAFMNVGFFRPNETFVTVPFNGVNFNLGGGYNSKTSIYTCPVDGVYFFTYSIYSGLLRKEEDHQAYASLVVDNRYVNAAHCYTQTVEFMKCQATNSATIYCGKNKKVMIKTTGNSVQMYEISSRARTTFNGFLLYSN